MLRLGFCCEPDRIGDIAALGYDFLECNFTNLTDMRDDAFDALAEKLKAAPIPVEAANCLLPARLKVVGPDVDGAALSRYLETGFARAARIGIRVVVFGSGGARGVPEGFSAPKAWRQIASFLQVLSGVAGRHGVDVVIEPLRRRECNILNYVSEAVALAAVLRLDHVFALGDTFHMDMGGEPLSALTMAGDTLRHVHVSQSLDEERGRIVPREENRDSVYALFDTLHRMGYQGRASVEASYADLRAEAGEAFTILDAARRR